MASIPEVLENLETYWKNFKNLSENFNAIPKWLVLHLFRKHPNLKKSEISFFSSFCLGFRLYKLERISSFLESGRF